MLEQTRRQTSIFIYVIFGFLIVIFILGINPGNRGGAEGCGVSSNAAVVVDGESANPTAYLVAYSAARDFFGNATGRQKVYLALDEIIRRELLAQAAAERGIRATGDHIDREIIEDRRGYFYVGGQRIDVTPQFFDEVDGERLFKRDRWVRWINGRDVQSAGSYREEQARGLQASLFADLIAGSVRVSRDEALAEYLYDNHTVTYDVVAFDPKSYRSAMRLTDADVTRFLESHGAEVQARYQADERLYKGLKPQLALREIFIPKALPEADKAARPDDKAAKPDAKKPAAGDAPKPFGLPNDVAKAKLEAVRAQILAGKLTFIDAEKQLAADSSEDAPAENGDRGWRSADNAELDEKAVNDAVKTLKPGEMTPVIATDRGTYLVIATDKREGDLSFDQVKNEIAREIARDVWSKEAAKRDALAALADARAGTGKSLDQMFEREPVKPNVNVIEQIINNPNLSPEQKEQILQQLQQQKQGSLDVHEEDVPVAWYAEADGSAQGAAPAAAAGSAAPAGSTASAGSTAPAGSTTPAGSAAPAGSPSGSAGSAAGTGSGSAAAPAQPAPPAEIVASKDVLPQLGEITKPRINRFGPSPRQARMPGIGSTRELTSALFDELSPGTLSQKLYEGEGGSYLLVQLVDRKQAKIEDFEKAADAKIAQMQEARGKAALRGWLKSRCETLAKAGRIRPAAERIRETDDQGNPAPTVYRPCMFFDYLGG